MEVSLMPEQCLVKVQNDVLGVICLTICAIFTLFSMEILFLYSIQMDETTMFHGVIPTIFSPSFWLTLNKAWLPTNTEYL